ncbi:MAG: prephenate dehydrogenase/arogenate dehydrogenase family protein [Nitrospirota bacterium]|nr:prephenate dehydrogenase/arogenate dehydrogenase family protein [Nitrospirota bacterium]MDP2383838.1 prephenate dehydrogenase/arogenate dehydrogenase family protein [Nitrospirota bacterium]MDP3599441.1 prephenate dehydrogenase/arogenate dehydrogenase family protein [Nitrospirota bacterium]
MALHFTQVTIIGVGLIGGSLGMILRRKGLATKIVGVGRRVENLKTAVELGAIDCYVADPKDGVRDADLVVLATPVDTYDRHLTEWASSLKPGAIVTDVGSVKGLLVEQAERAMPTGVHFVGAHPIAGKEKTGVAAGSDRLFMGARCIITPTNRTNPQALEQVQAMWRETGSVVLTMDAHLHDKVLGAVSHLPHVAAFALINALAEIREQQIPSLDLARHSGGGLRDTTRIAASSPEMWRDIFLWNRDNVVMFIEAYERSLGQLKQLIQAGDAAGIEKTLERARQEREKLSTQPAVSA